MERSDSLAEEAVLVLEAGQERCLRRPELYAPMVVAEEVADAMARILVIVDDGGQNRGGRFTDRP
jgi:hypothetical protein